MVLIESISKRVIRLDHGKLMADGSRDEIIESYLVGNKLMLIFPPRFFRYCTVIRS